MCEGEMKLSLELTAKLEIAELGGISRRLLVDR